MCHFKILRVALEIAQRGGPFINRVRILVERLDLKELYEKSSNELSNDCFGVPKGI
jgi:hypothetical protein